MDGWVMLYLIFLIDAKYRSKCTRLRSHWCNRRSNLTLMQELVAILLRSKKWNKVHCVVRR
jgi:hypothetical protein